MSDGMKHAIAAIVLGAAPGVRGTDATRDGVIDRIAELFAALDAGEFESARDRLFPLPACAWSTST